MLKYLLPLLLSAFLLSSCDRLSRAKKHDDVLARVHNKYLYASEIQGLINPGTSPQDSITIVSNYLNNWVRQQLLLFQAERTLSESQKNFSQQLENYRNSLIIYEYESYIVRKKLDPLFSIIEIQEYYDKNRTNFELKENIVKVNYVQLENDSNELARLKKLWQASDEESKAELEIHCIQNGLNYSLFEDSWIYFNDFLKQVPIITYNQKNFLQHNRSIEVRDSLYVYLVEIKDFKIKESMAPLSILVNDIKKIIINRRKLDLLQKLQNDIFENAIVNNQFEIY